MTQRALPRSALGKAIAYTSGLWPGLVRFLGDPKIPLDTNGVERALRGVAVGRRNHYGSRSERGTRGAALFYSLIESAKLCSVEPRGYLGEAARRAIRDPGTVRLPRDLNQPKADEVKASGDVPRATEDSRRSCADTAFPMQIPDRQKSSSYGTSSRFRCWTTT